MFRLFVACSLFGDFQPETKRIFGRSKFTSKYDLFLRSRPEFFRCDFLEIRRNDARRKKLVRRNAKAYKLSYQKISICKSNISKMAFFCTLSMKTSILT